MLVHHRHDGQPAGIEAEGRRFATKDGLGDGSPLGDALFGLGGGLTDDREEPLLRREVAEAHPQHRLPFELRRRTGTLEPLLQRLSACLGDRVDGAPSTTARTRRSTSWTAVSFPRAAGGPASWPRWAPA